MDLVGFPRAQRAGGRGSKVPDVTIWFWLVKVMATAVGETAADLLSVKLHLGLGATSAIMTGVCAVTLALQIRAARYVPALYWSTVVAISVVGTLVSDDLVNGLGISLADTSTVLAIILAIVFQLWFAWERALSIRSVVTACREGFTGRRSYSPPQWEHRSAIFSPKPWISATGRRPSYMPRCFGAIAALLHGAKANTILCFWAAYVLTRPLGASVGDLAAKPHIAGGCGFGTVTTSLMLLCVILVLIVYLTICKVDRQSLATSSTLSIVPSINGNSLA